MSRIFSAWSPRHSKSGGFLKTILKMRRLCATELSSDEFSSINNSRNNCGTSVLSTLVSSAIKSQLNRCNSTKPYMPCCSRCTWKQCNTIGNTMMWYGFRSGSKFVLVAVDACDSIYWICSSTRWNVGRWAEMK